MSSLQAMRDFLKANDNFNQQGKNTYQVDLDIKYTTGKDTLEDTTTKVVFNLLHDYSSHIRMDYLDAKRLYTEFDAGNLKFTFNKNLNTLTIKSKGSNDKHDHPFQVIIYG